MNHKLITALRTAATAIKNGSFRYNWYDVTTCNCGVVIGCLLGLSPKSLDIRLVQNGLARANGTWSERASEMCPIIGIPEVEIFRTLYSMGLTATEIHHLEYLSDPEIRARMPLRHRMIRMKKNESQLACYLRAWADLLVERGTADVVDEARRPVEVCA